VPKTASEAFNRRSLGKLDRNWARKGHYLQPGSVFWVTQRMTRSFGRGGGADRAGMWKRDNDSSLQQFPAAAGGA